MHEGAGAEGILLYYAYRDLSRPGIRDEACQWYTQQCQQQVGTTRHRLCLEAALVSPLSASCLLAEARLYPLIQCLYAIVPLRQGLVGRVRVALDGLNATLGGSMAALRAHIASVEARFGEGGPPIDFKLAESEGRRNTAVMQQSVSPGVACLRPAGARLSVANTLPWATLARRLAPPLCRALTA